MNFGIITALATEYSCLPSSLRDRAICCGVGARNATNAAESLIAGGADALLSFGISGALDTSLCSGQALSIVQVIQIPDNITYSCNSLTSNYPTATQLCVNTPVIHAADKLALGANWSAHAVDMESSAVAAVAQHAQKPFFCMRVICDQAEDNLPAELVWLMGENSRVNPFALLASVVRRPTLLTDLFMLNRKYRIALRSLAAVGAELPKMIAEHVHQQ
ncbi:conserved hypothetical protein [Teredinibacter turnerae T7901]|uniref:Nucleoside phosphorylase domain-containing protein n=1 Tax=Teredinibacter turnerae (strain ATCC 39867 / T7901) TaxID=377629 RepID=C5BPY3_TERTT|nr:hypothetical protein [Teredinibacter turnerae]ACR14545.1 conserved hypothetical protein [Teredinibacter turnerae T7901]